ncbi:MAG: hypothetical protein V3T88_00710, partial [Nitrosomonadaceae bacterium]
AIHSPNAMKKLPVSGMAGGRNFCPWCGKHGGNDSAMNNHIRRHLQLSLACSRCGQKCVARVEQLHQHYQKCPDT